MGVVEAQGSILRSSSMWMVSYHLSFTFGFLVLALNFNILLILFLSGLLFLATSQPSDDYTG